MMSVIRTLLLLACFQLWSFAALGEEAARYSLKALKPGSGLYRDTLIDGSTLPFDKTYAQLTKDQQDRLKSQYERLSDNDEPPFPVAGLAEIYHAAYAAQQKRMADGPLSVLVDVDANGSATSAAVYQTPDAELGDFVAAVLLRQKFKPAICEGQPCPMVYPFRVNFRVR